MSALTFLVLTATAAGAPRAVTLEDALAIARLHQPSLRQAHATSRAAEARADQARASLLPQVNATASYGRRTANFVARPGSLPPQIQETPTAASFNTFNDFNFGVTANQLIFDFGRTWNQWDAAKATAASQQENERTAAASNALDVRTAYFQARAAKALVAVAKDGLSNQDRHLEQIRAFVEAGTRPEIDLAQARTDRANAVVQLVNAENSHATGIALLVRAIGLPTPAEIEVTDEVVPPVEGEAQTADELIDEAIQARPELAAIAEQIHAEEEVLASVRGAYWPSLGASTSFTDGGPAPDSLAWNWSLSLTISWPIFQGLLTRAQSEEADASLEALAAQTDALRQEVRFELEQARLAVRAGRTSLAAAADAVEASKERLRLAEGRYETGVGSALELSDAQLARTTAAAQQVQAELQLATSRAQLLRALGRP